MHTARPAKMERMEKSMEPKQFIQIANSYIERGFSVIPVGVDKKPLIKWEQYQKRIANPEEVERWAKRFKNSNIAIVTGSLSGIVVVDVEAGGPVDGLPPTVIAKTGGGGWHFYYKHPGYEFKNSARKLRELTDIRGDGGYVVAPPSLHKSGKHYEWSVSADAADFDDVPEWILRSLVPAKAEVREANDWERLLTQDNHEGTRNDMAAKVVGYLLSTVNQSYWDSTAWASFTAWNLTYNKPPLPEREWRHVPTMKVSSMLWKFAASTTKRACGTTSVVALCMSHQNNGKLPTFHQLFSGASHIKNPRLCHGAVETYRHS